MHTNSFIYVFSETCIFSRIFDCYLCTLLGFSRGLQRDPGYRVAQIAIHPGYTCEGRSVVG